MPGTGRFLPDGQGKGKRILNPLLSSFDNAKFFHTPPKVLSKIAGRYRGAIQEQKKTGLISKPTRGTDLIENRNLQDKYQQNLININFYSMILNSYRVNLFDVPKQSFTNQKKSKYSKKLLERSTP